MVLLATPSPTSGQQCDGVRSGRVWVLAGAYVATQAAVLAVRADNWWITPTTSFRATWDRSANKEQDGLLNAAVAHQASQITAFAWEWTCVDYKTAGWLGAATAVDINIPKEIGDGVHEGRSFSLRDMLWTVAGATLPAYTVPLR